MPIENANNLLDTTGYDNINDILPSDGGLVGGSPLSAATLAQAQIPPMSAVSAENSPLTSRDLTGILLDKTQQMEPLRPEVEAKRQALQNAYQNLIQTQQYTPPPPDLPYYQAADAMTNVPGASPSIRSGIQGNLALTEEQYKQQQMQEAAKQQQATTGIEAAKTATGFQGQDIINATDLMKQASLNDYRNAMMGARLNKAVKMPDGSEAVVDASTGKVTPITDKFGNPLNPSNVQGSPNAGAPSAPNIDQSKVPIASQLGVPVAPMEVDPTRGMTPQGRSTYLNKLETQLQEGNKNNQQIQDQLTNLDHFTQENANTSTGSWKNLPIINSIITATDPAYQTMNSLNKQFSVGPGMRPQGMRVTQGEWNVFRQATTSTQNTPEANLNIANAMKAKLQRDMDYNNFMSDYTATNGHNVLADNYFNQYMKDNPIFSPDANPKNNFQLNPNRMTYKDYFNSKGLTGAQPISSQTSATMNNSPAIAAAVKAGQPIGVANNNPGNVRNGQNGSFGTSATPEQGIATTASNLLAYNDKYGINNVEGIVSRWAPPIDTVTGQKNDTPAYIKDVASQLNIDPKKSLNMKDPATLYALTTAIIKHENGSVPYNPIQLANGVQMAIKQNQQQRLISANPQDIVNALRVQGVVQ